MSEPEFIELDGYKLAIPPDHPAFYHEPQYGWFYRRELLRNNLVEETKRPCAAEAFSYWIQRWISHEIPHYQHKAMGWAWWGKLDKIAEGK